MVFMYDDIANNKLNPRPGVIINRPDGDDVYAGVPKVKFDHMVILLVLSLLLWELLGEIIEVSLLAYSF